MLFKTLSWNTRCWMHFLALTLHSLTQTPQDSFRTEQPFALKFLGHIMSALIFPVVSLLLMPFSFFCPKCFHIKCSFSVCLFFRVLLPCIGKINWYWPYYPLKYSLERLWHLWPSNVLEFNSLLLKSWRMKLYCITVFADNTCPLWDEVLKTKTTWVFICL